MSGTEISDLEVLRLETRVALAVIPLVSKSVAFMDDRQSIVTDIVRCWLALPEGVKAGYHRIGHPNGHGITYFGYDYVDLVERDGESEAEPGPALSSDLVEEQLVCQRWGDRLDVIMAGRNGGAIPDPAWLAGFPLYPEDLPAAAPGAANAA
jgi:hypothetical protein